MNFFRANVNEFLPRDTYDIIFSSGVFHYIAENRRQPLIEALKANTTWNGLNVLNVFVQKPFIEDAPDREEGEVQVKPWYSGELDYHIHTSFSPDSSMKPKDAVEKSITAGITDMCFTEHMDLGHPMESFNKIPDLDGMQSKVLELREAYPQIWIGHGLELGYMAESVEQSIEVLSGHSFDYVLLSVHCVDGLDCYFPEATRGRDKQTMYQRYLETVLESVKDKRLLEFYDCVGHIGYISKCRHYEENSLTYEMFPELLDEILMTIIQNGKGIEINTSGIDKVGHVLPHPSIIKRYRELGGNIITVGSDAHTPEQVGKYITDTMKLISL